MDWKPTATKAEAASIALARHIDAGHLTDCSACHR
jgi:hypothetical protein